MSDSIPQQIPPSAVGCNIADKVNDWINKIVDPGPLVEEYRAIFRDGVPLADIAKALGQQGLASEHDVEWISNIPVGVQDEISATMLMVLEREDPWRIQFGMEAADDYALRLEEDLDAKVATFVMIGPH